MSDRFGVESELDRTVVRVSRPPYLRHHQPLFAFALFAALGSVLATGYDQMVLAQGLFGMVFVFLIGAGLAYRVTPEPDHRIELSAASVTVDGQPLDIASLTMVITDQKVVFRDDEQLVELWHYVSRHADRMELRRVLEEAVDGARARHGAGASEVPEHLRQAREPKV